MACSHTPGITATWQARGAAHPGITAAAAAPGAAFTVMPRVGPTPPRSRATVPLTPRPESLLRFRSQQAEFEADISAELDAARPHRLTDLADRYRVAGGVPTRDQLRSIAIASKALSKCSMQPKHVMSAMINVDDPDSWRLPFGHYPTLTLHS